MKALILYPLFVVIGAAIAITLGLLIERSYSHSISLVVFLALFFFNFWLAWVLTKLIVDRIVARAAKS